LEITELLNIGIIGMGKMGLLHASILNTIPGVCVLAFFDKSRILKWFTRKALAHVMIIDNFGEFAAQKYNAVYVTTPIPTHFAVIKELMSSGITKNIFVEKTLAANYSQSLTLCEEARAAGGVNMVGYMSRFARTFQRARELLHGEKIGEPIAFNAYAFASDFADSKSKPSSGKGGATRDLGAHIVDLSLWLFGELDIFNDGSSHIDENCSSFKVHSSNGLTGKFDISWTKQEYRLPEYGLSIIGSKGTLDVNTDVIRLENAENNITWHRQDLDENVPFLLGATEYYRENEHFIKAVRGNFRAEPDFAAASRADRLIEQAEQEYYRPHEQ
jgi:predicted dehydrogenase